MEHHSRFILNYYRLFLFAYELVQLSFQEQGESWYFSLMFTANGLGTHTKFFLGWLGMPLMVEEKPWLLSRLESLTVKGPLERLLKVEISQSSESFRSYLTIEICTWCFLSDDPRMV